MWNFFPHTFLSRNSPLPLCLVRFSRWGLAIIIIIIVIIVPFVLLSPSLPPSFLIFSPHLAVTYYAPGFFQFRMFLDFINQCIRSDPLRGELAHLTAFTYPEHVHAVSTKFGFHDSNCCEKRDDLHREAAPRLFGSLGSADNFGPTVTFVFLPVIVSWWSGHGPDHRKRGNLRLVVWVKREEPPSLKILSSKDVISECLSSLSFPFAIIVKGERQNVL